MNTSKTIQTLAAAVALACAGQAGAVSLSAYNEASTGIVTLRLGGATATESSIVNMLRLTTTGAVFCVPGSLDVYRLNSDNFRIFSCTGGANSGASGKQIVIIRNGSFGSGQGVSALVKGTTPVVDITGTTVTSVFPDVNNATIKAAPATSTVAASGSFASYVLHELGTSTGLTTTVAMDAGVSDEEPAAFKNVFVPALSSSDLGKLEVKGISGVIFGVPVTNVAYQRLQALQFASSSVCHPANAGYGGLGTAATAANSEACMPSLGRDTIAGIYSGTISDWSEVKSAQNGTDSVASVDITGDGTADALADTNIYIERRVSSSGTQVATATYFLNQNCAVGGASFTTNAENPSRVRENGGSSDVRNNLGVRQDAGLGAVGVLSTETVFAPTSGTASLTKSRFIKVNGYAPSLLNVVKGNYDFYYESTMQYRKATVGGISALTSVTGGTAKKTMFDAIVARLGNPASVSKINEGFSHTFGRAGLVSNAVTYAGSVAATPYDVSSGAATDVYLSPVATNTRGPAGTPNACINPVKVSGIQVGN